MSQDEAKRTQGCLWGFFLKYVVHLLILIVAVQGLPFWELSQGHQRFQGTAALELVLDTLGCSTAEAGEVSVFGPKKYIRTTGKPNIVVWAQGHLLTTSNCSGCWEDYREATVMRFE